MSGLVVILLIGSISSLVMGIAASLLVIWPWPAKSSGKSDNPFRTVYWSYGGWTAMLGVFLMSAPPDWFGPSWNYFPELPHNGFGMGLSCTTLAALLLFALWQNANEAVLSVLLFACGFVYWMGGILLGAEGLLGHQGLIEAPLMLIIGGQAHVHSAVLFSRYRSGRRP